MLNFLKIALSIQLLYFAALSSAEADLVAASQTVCQAEGTEDRAQAFISHYGLDGLYTQVREIVDFSTNFNLENSDEIQSELLRTRANFNDSTDAIAEFRAIMTRLIASGDDELFTIMENYSRELYFAVEESANSVIDILDVNERITERNRLVAEAKALLIETYSAQYNPVVNSNEDLSEDEKTFLIENSFAVVPNHPGYEWTESANELGTYVWSVYRASNVFEVPGGILGNIAMYRFETIVNSDNPGLHLNLAYQRQEQTQTTRFNVAMIFSPFTNTVPIEVCDYNFVNHKGECVALDIDSWCEAHNQ